MVADDWPCFGVLSFSATPLQFLRYQKSHILVTLYGIPFKNKANVYPSEQLWPYSTLKSNISWLVHLFALLRLDRFMVAPKRWKLW